MSAQPQNSAAWQSLSSVLHPMTALAGSETARRATIRMEVAKAIAEDRVILAYQPVVSARKGHPVAFYEGLVRLVSEDGIPIPTSQFMPYVDETSLGPAIDCAVLRIALVALADDPCLRLSINIGPGTIKCDEWLDTLAEAQVDSPGLLYRLIVEVTENCELNCNPDMVNFLNKIRAFGCATAIDDFGAGRTSLAHLRVFGFDVVKIDRTLAQGIALDADKQVMVRSIISIARHFDMLVVGEFVETAADSAMLASLGVDCLQGYLYGEPTELPNDGPKLGII